MGNEIRYDNLSLDGLVGFLDEGHKYVHLEKPDLKFTSVTTLIAKYKEKFDAEKVARECVENEKSKYFGMDWREVALNWHEYGASCAAKGTEMHQYGEDEFNMRSYCEDLLNKRTPLFIPDNPKAKYVAAAIEEIYKKGYQLAKTELLMYSLDQAIAGQSDIILKKKVFGTSEYNYMIYDWKFLSKKIQRKSFYSKKGGYKMMTGPFKHLMDCNWIHYSIQLALYQTLSGDPGKVTEKVLLIVMDDGYELVPAYPMRVFWDQNDELQCVHEVWNGRWWDSRMGQLYKHKPKDIIGI